jgi:hypothetical protein
LKLERDPDPDRKIGPYSGSWQSAIRSVKSLPTPLGLTILYRQIIIMAEIVSLNVTQDLDLNDRVSENDGSLLISTATFEDSGIYSVTADNGLSEVVTAHVELKVQPSRMNIAVKKQIHVPMLPVFIALALISPDCTGPFNDRF